MFRQCNICSKNFATARTLRVHRKNIHNEQPQTPPAMFTCVGCGHEARGVSKMMEHFNLQHPTAVMSCCYYCCNVYETKEELNAHVRSIHGLPTDLPTLEQGTSESAFNGALKVYELYPDEAAAGEDLLDFLIARKPDIAAIVLNATAKSAQKLQLTAEISLYKPMEEDIEERRINIFIPSSFKNVYHEGLQDNDFMEAVDQMVNSLVTFATNGSGWMMGGVKRLFVKFAKFAPLKGSSYIALPTELQNLKQCLLNIRNHSDFKCFSYSFTAAYHKQFGPNLETSWRTKDSPDTYSELNANAHQPVGEYDWPMSIFSIGKFEKLNKVSINVFQWIDKQLVPLRVSRYSSSFTVNLLLLSDGSVHHYVLITNLELLVCKLQKKTYLSNKKICSNCLHMCHNDSYDQHVQSCYANDPVVIQMPEPGSKIRFRNIAARWFVPIVVYFDLESLLVPISGPQNNPTSSNTRAVEKHVPSGYALAVVEHGNPCPEVILERGENCMASFISRLEEIARNAYRRKRRYMFEVPPPAIPRAAANNCWICEVQFVEGDLKVIDHCHFTGRYLGWAHSSCNLQRRIQNFTPVVAHNLANYDLHHVCLALDAANSTTLLNVIPNTDEKYISFTLSVLIKTVVKQNGMPMRIYEHLRFIDSFKFMTSSLEKLASYLSFEKFIYIDQVWSQRPENERNLLKTKGFYPYNYFDSFDKFAETVLPPMEQWVNSLTGTVTVKHEDYAHAVTVYNTFRCRNLGDYHDLYLQCDVLILATVFEQFREVCYSTYGLDSAQFYTTSNLAGEAFYKTCKVSVELLSDRDHLDMAENLLRGGVASVFDSRFFKANNKDVPDYKPNKPSEYGFLIDANNLYGGIMLNYPLPLDGFRLNNEIPLNDILNTSAESPIGYIIEVDLCYPDHLHNLHADFPLAPEKRNVEQSWLGPYQQRLWGSTKGSSAKKLLQTLYNKTSYTIHYLTLQLYVRLGLGVERVHRVLQFNQQKWLAKYITLNTEKRQSSQNAFEENFYKLMSNSAFGKCCENVRKRTNVTIVRDVETLLRSTNRNSIKSFKIFKESLAAITMKPTKIKMKRPIIIGAVILDLAKMFMFHFHYEVMKRHLTCKLLYSDTDSLLYRITTEDLYQAIDNNPELKSHFDFSNLPRSHPMFNADNKMVVLKFKDEMKGETVCEFIGLKAKMYSITTRSSHKMSAKGVARNAQTVLKHNKYLQVLRDQRRIVLPNMRIGSNHHQLFTYNVNKVSLSAFDDKRYIFPNGELTLPYGHHSVRDEAFTNLLLADDEWGEEETEHITTQSPRTTLIQEQWTPPDPGLNQQQLNDSDLSSVDWDFDDGIQSPEPNPFFLTEAVESDCDEETLQPPRKRFFPDNI